MTSIHLIFVLFCFSYLFFLSPICVDVGLVYTFLRSIFFFFFDVVLFFFNTFDVCFFMVRYIFFLSQILC